MKKLLALLLVLLITFSLFGCKPREETKSTAPEQTWPTETEPLQTQPEVGTATPLLYCATDENDNVIWLFGSIHVGKEEYYPLPDYVMDAYNGSDALAVEFDLLAYENDFAAQLATAQKMIYADGTVITDHIPEKLYDEAVALLEEAGVYNAEMDYCMPVMWYSALSSLAMEQAGAKTELGVDRYFLELAKEDKKEILEVESADYQTDMLAGFSEDLQILLLESMVQFCSVPAAMKVSLNLLLNVWASGKEDSLALYLGQTAEPTTGTGDIYGEFSDEMVVYRNDSMTRWAEETLTSGKEVFMVVGAAHIVGEGAVAENLRELGYTVEQVFPAE